MAAPYFTQRTFAFLRDLADNNDRAWFAENKDRYERDVREPALAFIVDFAPRLKKISPHFRADPRKAGGSLFRIHRDTRFAKDKSPYKTNTGIQFRHEAGRDAHAPGFYLHIEPGAAFMALGAWHPDAETLRAIRDAIVEDPRAWGAATVRGSFPEVFTLAGDSLVRGPRGYDPEHPRIEDLKRKDFVGVTDLSKKRLTAPDFLDQFEGLCRAGAPLVRWLCRATGHPF